MNIKISPYRFNKQIQVPSSKSYLQRYIALASLSNGISVIKNPNYCDDVISALNVAKSLGASVDANADEIRIRGIGYKKVNDKIIIDVGESGLCARMFGVIAPALYNRVIINGCGSLLKRNMRSLIEVLQNAGCKVISDNEYLPIEVQGWADFKNIELVNTDTSQIVTGLMYAAFLMNDDVYIKIPSPVSVPYIQISIEVAEQFGLKVECSSNYKEIYIQGQQEIKPVQVVAEGDWSNAAFFIVAAALSGKCVLSDLNPNSIQGDKIILDIVQNAGAKVYWKDGKCFVEKNNLMPFEYDLTHYPDLFPPLTILALGIKGKSVLYGVQRLLNKESNRAKVLQKEFSNIGGDIKIENDKLIINGKGYLNGGVVHSHNDHRIAMAAAVAACVSEKEIIIYEAEAVHKSFPNFFDFINTKITTI